jgi:hypothetical protein
MERPRPKQQHVASSERISEPCVTMPSASVHSASGRLDEQRGPDEACSAANMIGPWCGSGSTLRYHQKKIERAGKVARGRETFLQTS